MLQMNKEHDTDPWVVFVGLSKVFVSIHHELMLKPLQTIGISNCSLQVIKKLYRDFKIQIKIGKCKNLIDYTTRVKQGDNLAPNLFIIVMQFLVELLEKK